MLRKMLSIGLVVMMCLVSVIGIQTVPVPASEQQDSAPQGLDNPYMDDSTRQKPNVQDGGITNGQSGPTSAYLGAEESGSGQLLPLTVEQLGFSFTSPTDARTDSMVNLLSSLNIDTAHGWKASRADLDVWNLTRMYAVNGSFDEGVPGTNEYPAGNVAYHPYGWDSTSYSPDVDTIQRSAYKTIDRRYVVLEDEGKPIGTGVNLNFLHADNTSINWTQPVTNVPYADQFILSLDYMYLRGPLGAGLGNITLAVNIDGTRVWYVNLDDLAAREEWYNSGNVAVNVTGVGSTFNLTIELRVETEIKAFPVDIGFINAYYMTAYVDDLVLKGITPPGFEEVALTFHAGSQSTPVGGLLGTGVASISNTSYWTDASLQFSVSSNSSVALAYQVHLLNHRFLNSSYAADTIKVGTAYSITPGSSTQLTLYTYLGTLEGYENYTLRIHKPNDWENTTVLDPFLYDTTAQCSLLDEIVEVPTAALDNMGWWQLKFEAPNYLESASVQWFDSDLSQWFDAYSLRTGNTTRAVANLGTPTDVPIGPYTVDVAWKLPNGSIWASETMVGGGAGEVNSSSHVLDSSGAGVWTVAIEWNNGTEVAFGVSSFLMLHQTSLTPVNNLIETDAGLTVVVRVYYIDTETGQYILTLGTAVNANWSTTVSLQPNAENNWWQGELDTSLVPLGEHQVILAASHDYYDSAQCSVTVISTAVTRLSSPNSPWTSSTWNTTAQLTFHYEVLNHETSVWSPAVNTSGLVQATVNWTSGSWSMQEAATEGVYELLLDTSAFPAGTKLLNVTFTRQDYYPKQVLLTLIVSQAASSLTVQGLSSVRIDVDDTYGLKLAYRDEYGYGISGATVVVDYVPGSGLVLTSVQEVIGEPGNYSLSITVTTPGVFTLRFVASHTNVESAVAVFVLVTNDLDTRLSVLSGETAQVGLMDNYEATVKYGLLNGTGIDSASLQIVFSGPSEGLTWGSIADIGLGQYSMNFTASLSGTYVITFAASKYYHKTASNSSFLLASEISTTLTLLNASPVVIGMSEDYRLAMLYSNSTGYPLDGAAVDVASVTPSTGLAFGAVNNESSGRYSILLIPVTTGTYSVLLTASLLNHATALATLILLVNEISTTLTLLNASPDTITLGEQYRLAMRFTNISDYGLDGATVKIASVSPTTGLQVGATAAESNGYYSITLTPIIVGAYSILVRANLTNHEVGLATFILVVNEITSSLTLLNESPAVITFGMEYRLVVLYTNATSHGLDGATIEIASVSPADGLEGGITNNETDGYYSVVLSASKAGTYSVTIKASLLNHVTALASFTLSVLSVSTVLIAVILEEKVSLDRNTTLYLTYQTEGLVALPGAEIVAVDVPEGLGLTPAVDLGNGTYSVVVVPDETGAYTLVFRADLENHQTAYTAVPVTVVETPTSLRTVDEVYSSSVMFGSALDLHLLYERTDDGTNITSGEFAVNVQPLSNMTWRVTEQDGIYHLYLSVSSLGHFTITIAVERARHTPAIVTYRLDVTEIDTNLAVPPLGSTLYVSKTYALVVVYTASHNASGIVGAFFTRSGLGSGWLTIDELDNGQYNISIQPDIIGSYTVTVTIGREGFRSRSIELTFEVVRIPLKVTLDSRTYAREGTSFEIVVHVTEEATGEPVTGALVEYRISWADSGSYIAMTEDDEPGVYRATHTLPAWDDITDYSLEVRVDKDNYQLQTRFVVAFTKEPDTIARITPVVTSASLGAFALVGVLAFARYRTAQRRKINLEATAAKKRFDDVSNLIGIIVLHRSSGLTIYSKILRGGIDETVIGAFVAAITHFREEFRMEGKHWDFEVIPISDVVSAVPTKSLICAFITAGKPSLNQETKMEAYGRAVGAMFDEMLSETDGTTIDDATAKLFDDLFVNVLDGFLLKPFRRAENGGFPRKMKCLAITAEHIDGEAGFTLEQLARGMTACGIEESHAYKLIVEAIEEELLASRDVEDAKAVSAFMDRDT